MKRAFTIIELSIVLLIITLMISVIVVSKTMISHASIRSVIMDLTEINKSVASVRLQYNAWPGDMSVNIYDFTSNGPGNGNGNNIIESTSFGCNQPESILAWNHLYYTGNYYKLLSGISGSSTPCIKIGKNVPQSKISSGFYYLWNAAGNTGSMFGITVGNIIHFGSLSSNDNSINGSILSINDSSDLDRKVDDGIANKGILLAIDGNDVSLGMCSNGWSSVGSDYNYNSTNNPNNSIIGCRLIYLLEN